MSRFCMFQSVFEQISALILKYLLQSAQPVLPQVDVGFETNVSGSLSGLFIYYDLADLIEMDSVIVDHKIKTLAGNLLFFFD